jgi:hypothetical protein
MSDKSVDTCIVSCLSRLNRCVIDKQLHLVIKNDMFCVYYVFCAHDINIKHYWRGSRAETSKEHFDYFLYFTKHTQFDLGPSTVHNIKRKMNNINPLKSNVLLKSKYLSCTARKTQPATIVKIYFLMLFQEIITVYMRFQVFTAASMKLRIFWDVLPCF